MNELIAIEDPFAMEIQKKAAEAAAKAAEEESEPS
jgi:hypothetical protein